MKKRYYLDHNASTQLAPEVIDALAHANQELIANPSSIHSFGQDSKRALNTARKQVSEYLGTKVSEVVFTSGGSESINSILRGAFTPSFQGHLITSDLEHSAVYKTALELEKYGVEVTFLSPMELGAPTAEMVKDAIRPNTKLISLMAVNNETGIVTDYEGIARVAEEAEIPFFLDGVAIVGKENFTIPSGVSAMAFSGHKMHGPKGVGVTFLRKSFKVPSLITGGGQEFRKRSGTENLPGIVGIGVAFELLQKELPACSDQIRAHRDHFEEILRKEVGDIQISGEGQKRVSNTSNIAFNGVEGESLLMNLDLEGVCASHGSACSSGALEPSRVLRNMGYSRDRAGSSIRFSFCRYTQDVDVTGAAEIIAKTVAKLRA